MYKKLPLKSTRAFFYDCRRCLVAFIYVMVVVGTFKPANDLTDFRRCVNYVLGAPVYYGKSPPVIMLCDAAHQDKVKIGTFTDSKFASFWLIDRQRLDVGKWRLQWGITSAPGSVCGSFIVCHPQQSSKVFCHAEI